MEQTNYRRQFDGNVARLGKRRKDQKSEIEEQIGELGVGGQIVLGDLFCSFLLLTLFSHLSWRGQNWGSEPDEWTGVASLGVRLQLLQLPYRLQRTEWLSVLRHSEGLQGSER
jgi:hypothetical protein